MVLEMRAFVSIDIVDPAIVSKIVRIQDELRKLGLNAKFVEPQNLHITLKFLGEIPESKIERISRALEKACSGFGKFEIEIVGLGAFPSERSPRVIWLGVGKGATTVSEIAENVDRELGKLGFSREKNFVPHVTIARLKSKKDIDLMVDLFKKLSSYSFGTMLVDSIRLKKSILTPRGPIYEDVHVVHLG